MIDKRGVMMTKKRLGRLYTKLYDMASKIIKRDAPCRICVDPDERGYCCAECPHLSSNGCTVKALYCKVWLCSKVAEIYPETNNKLYSIAEIARKYRLLDIRASKKETMRRFTRL